MGVDTSVKIRIFNSNEPSFKEVTVSEQDNSLGSLFYNNEISYTSVRFDRHQELSAAENELFDLTEDAEDELLAYSRVSAAKDVLAVTDKIYRKLFRLKSVALNNDLTGLMALDISEEEKLKRRHSKISDYLDFESSFSIFRGIIKTASEQQAKIQIIHEFY